MTGHAHHRRPARRVVTDVYHQIICRHQVEIEVWPAQAEVHFSDDWTANPATTQARFNATVFNSAQGHTWEVRDVFGGPGQGTIDPSGLYRAPAKNGRESGATELVVATSREDPLRKATAWVTLVGLGPKPVKEAEVAVFPKQVYLYYLNGANNNMIDESNKARMFEAQVFNSGAQVEWLVDGVPQGAFGPWFLYQTPANGSPTVVTVRAQLQGSPFVFAEAKVLQLNYDWPGV